MLAGESSAVGKAQDTSMRTLHFAESDRTGRAGWRVPQAPGRGRGRSGQAGVRDLDADRQQLSFTDRPTFVLGEGGRSTQEQGAAVITAEHAGEDPHPGRDLVQDLAALSNPDDAGVEAVGHPD